MTSPVTTEALVEARELVRQSLKGGAPGLTEATREAVVGSIMLKLTNKVLAPLLAAHQQVTAERDETRDLAYELKLATAGGEDVPGSANLVTVDDVRRWCAEDARLIATATSELARLRAEGEAKDRALKDLRADAAELAGVLCYVSAHDDPKALRDLCWKAGHFLENRIVGIEPTAPARAATAREG
jgi:hypothetical protein